MNIDYKKWTREIWEVANGESWEHTSVGNLDSIEIKLRRMISEYEKSKINFENTVKLDLSIVNKWPTYWKELSYEMGQDIYR